MSPVKYDTDNGLDGDGLLDGQEIGRTSASVDTLVSVFRADSDPSSTTNPNAADTDADGLSDRLEDANLNGRVDSEEPNPILWDTDGDKLPDGWVNVSSTPGVANWTGEDKNLNGSRDQDADGNWTETDFLANDSDVDGILDGQETNGTWCFKGESSCAPGVSINDSRRLHALNPDFDGDGLRDGQEIAGWMVGIWYERTMEKKVNYTVNSNPAVANSDADALSDFEEFMNGSDPRALDTDKDGINDTLEIERKSNITGVEGSPPQIENVTVSVALAMRGYEACVAGLCTTLYLPDHLELHVAFDVSDAVGVDRVTLRVTKLSGVETRTFELGGAFTRHFDEAFAFGLLEALATGADVNITAYDVNGNGAWGQFHQDSVVEAVAKAVVAYFTAIAKVIVEAASAFLSVILSIIQTAMEPMIKPIVDQIGAWIQSLARALGQYQGGFAGGGRAMLPPEFMAELVNVTFRILFELVPIIVVLAVIAAILMFVWGSTMPVLALVILALVITLVLWLTGFAVRETEKTNHREPSQAEVDQRNKILDTGGDLTTVIGAAFAIAACFGIKTCRGLLTTAGLRGLPSAIFKLTAGSVMDFLWDSDAGGVAESIIGLVLMGAGWVNVPGIMDDILFWLGWGLAVLGFLVTIKNEDPVDKARVFTTMWFWEELVSALDFAIGSLQVVYR